MREIASRSSAFVGWGLLGLLGLGPALAQSAPDPDTVFHDFDSRFEQQPSAQVEAESLAHRAWAKRQAAFRFGDDAEIRFGALGAELHHLYKRSGWLTEPDAAGPVEIARAFLREHRDLFGLDNDSIASLHVVKEFTTKHNGVRHLLLQQMVDGVPVHHGEIRINLTASGEIINVGGNVHPDVEVPPFVILDPALAARHAAASIGVELDPLPAVVGRKDGPRAEISLAKGPFSEQIKASKAIVPVAGGARPAWILELHEKPGPDVYQVVVDAVDGTILQRHNLVLFSAPEGDIFPESPDPDGDGTNDAPTRVSFAGDPLASPLGWVFPGQTTTQGNNVIAHIDLEDDDDQNGFRPDGGTDLHFFFPFDDEWNLDETFGDQEIAVTNLFYHLNRFHDYMYSLGFDEPAGAMQEDNFGRGGLGGDRIFADAQDGANVGSRNNANWFPRPDGTSPRTQMFLFTFPDRDSCFDSDIIIHEFGHGVSNRLVGGALTAGCMFGPQSGAMGEGWSDYWAIDDTNDPLTDDPNGPEILAEYTDDDYTEGLRSVPYSTDTLINDLTFGDLCSSNNCQVHRDGTMWATVLFQVRRNLIVDHGAPGRAIMNQLVIDGLKLMPCGPSMLDARDAMLLADRVNNAGANQCSMWEGFSDRGMGTSAASLGEGSHGWSRDP